MYSDDLTCAESTAINLDAMTQSDLQRIAGNLSLSAPLRRYALLKAEAMHHRIEGNIVDALALERVCDRIYDCDMSDEERW